MERFGAGLNRAERPAGAQLRHHARQAEGADARDPEELRRRARGPASEKDAKLAQKLGQLQSFIAAFPQECMGQLASVGPYLTPSLARAGERHHSGCILLLKTVTW